MQDAYFMKEIMPRVRYAVIDIGSNSIRRMYEDEPGKLVITTRLSKGLADTGRLSEESMALSVDVIAALADEARKIGAFPAAYATSAVRDAENREAFIEKVRSRCGLEIDVLSGEREAKYAFDSIPAGSGLIDIGGASAQIATKDSKRSFRLGCVRAADIIRSLTGATSCDDNWPAQRAALNKYMSGLIEFPEEKPERFFGVGGSITTLGALKLGLELFDEASVDSSILSRTDVERLIETLCAKGSRRSEIKLLEQRHDVILYGAAILAFIMDGLLLREITVSTKDGMDGYLLYLRRLRKCHIGND